MKTMLIKAKFSPTMKQGQVNSHYFYFYVVVFFYQGYYGNGVNAIIVFAACFLPDSDREDYHEIMENLFL